MRKRIYIYAIAILGMVFMACNTHQPVEHDNTADIEAVKKLVNAYATTVSANNLEGYMEMYHSDIYRASSDTICYNTECVSWWVERAFGMAEFDYPAKIKRIKVDHDLAYAVIAGPMVANINAEEPMVQNMNPEVLLVLTKENGQWGITAEMFHDYEQK